MSKCVLGQMVSMRLLLQETPNYLFGVSDLFCIPIIYEKSDSFNTIIFLI